MDQFFDNIYNQEMTTGKIFEPSSGVKATLFLLSKTCLAFESTFLFALMLYIFIEINVAVNFI